MNTTTHMMPMTINEIVAAVDGSLAQTTDSRLSTDVNDVGGVGEERVATSVTTDSREVRQGSVFVAIVGEHVDGHDFLAAAAQAGAAAALVEHRVDSTRLHTPQQEGVCAGLHNSVDTMPQIVVKDCVKALGALAHHNIERRRASAGDFSIIGITGSVGKTTTKDLLHALLDTLGPTVAPFGSFNNDIGLPLTALQVGEDTRFLIAEMGANHVGEIEYLTTIAPPDVSVVLKVGTAHVGEFGSVERIAQAKSEIVRGLLPHGVAILNADDKRVSAMQKLAPGDVLWFSPTGVCLHDHELMANDIASDDWGRPQFTMSYCAEAAAGMAPDEDMSPLDSAVCDVAQYATAGQTTVESITAKRFVGEKLVDDKSVEENSVGGQTTEDHTAGMNADSVRVHLGITGKHNVANALAAAGVARYYGMSFGDIAKVLGDVQHISPHRMAISTVHEKNSTFTLIDDSFNANPDSMKAGIDALVQWGARDNPVPYRVAILGAMLELGPDETDLHYSVGRYAASSGLDAVIAVGSKTDSHVSQLAKDISAGVTQSHVISDIHVTESIDEAEKLVVDIANQHPTTVVLLKGSHASGLGSLAQRWLTESVTQTPNADIPRQSANASA